MALQTVGLKLLRIVIDRFVDVVDPDGGGAQAQGQGKTFALDQMLSQITAAVRPSLGEYQSQSQSQGRSVGLLENGCKALVAIAKRLSKSALKRLLKPLLPTKEMARARIEGEAGFYTMVVRLTTVANVVIENNVEIGEEGGGFYELAKRACLDGVKMLQWFDGDDDNNDGKIANDSNFIVFSGNSVKRGKVKESAAGKVLTSHIYKLAYVAAIGAGADECEMLDGVFALMIVGIHKLLNLPTFDADLYVLLKGVRLLLPKQLRQLQQDSNFVTEFGQLVEELIYAASERSSDTELFDCVCSLVALWQGSNIDGVISGDNYRFLARVCAEKQAWEYFITFLRELEVADQVECAKLAMKEGQGGKDFFPANTLLDFMDVGVVMGCLGGEIMSSFESAACGGGGGMDSCGHLMRVILVGYGNLIEGGGVGGVTELFYLLLPLLVKVVEFNGLPNGYLSGKGGGKGNSQIGRTAAQAMLHLMKTSQGCFKQAMGNVVGVRKGIIEMSVRGEMCGYGDGGGGVSPLWCLGWG